MINSNDKALSQIIKKTAVINEFVLFDLLCAVRLIRLSCGKRVEQKCLQSRSHIHDMVSQYTQKPRKLKNFSSTTDIILIFLIIYSGSYVEILSPAIFHVPCKLSTKVTTKRKEITSLAFFSPSLCIGYSSPSLTIGI